MAIKRKESEKRDEEKQTVKSKSRVSASSRPSKKVAKVPEKRDDGKRTANQRTIKKEEEPETRETPTKKVLGNLPVTTEMYTGADVDALLEANRLIEDEDIPGDFYIISMKSGRLIVRKVQEHT